MRTITLITLFLLSSSSAFCQQPCAPAGVPPCGPERNWPSAPQQAPPTIIVKVPQRIVMEGGSCQPPPSAPPAAAPPSAPAAPPGMFVAPPQTGTVMGERNSIMLHGPALHMPEFRIGLPSLELPSFQRMRQEARMNLSPAVAPTNRRRPYRRKCWQCLWVNTTPPSRRMPRPRKRRVLPQPPAPVPVNPGRRLLHAPAPPPCQPAFRSPGACPAAAPSRAASPNLPGDYLPAPPPPTPTALEMQLRRMEDMQRRIDAKLEQLTVLQREMQRPQGRAEIHILPAESSANSVRFNSQREIYNDVRPISNADTRLQSNDNRSVSESARGNSQQPNPVRSYESSQPSLQDPNSSTAERMPAEIRR